MALGEFALVADMLKKAIHMPSVIISDHDIYAALAEVAVQQRDQDALRKFAPLLEKAATSLEHKLYLAIAHRAWGVLFRLEGDFEDAEARLEQAVALFSGLDTRWQLGRTHIELAELAADRSDKARAEEHYVIALELFEEMSALPDAARTREGLSRLI